MKKRYFVVSLLLTVALVVITAGPVLAKKPLTTLTFDELDYQLVDGLNVNGVTFGFQSGDAWYHGPTPLGTLTYIQPPELEGSAMGTLTLTFDQPTTVVKFGVALGGYIPIPDPLPAGATVDLYRPGKGRIRQNITLQTSHNPDYSEGLFSYSGPAVKTVVITFDWQSGATRFMLDNLEFHKGKHLGN
jgi:hypothetical protein